VTQSLYLLSSDPAVVRDVAALRPGSAPVTCRDATALSAKLHEAPAPLALVDLEPDPQATLASLASLAARFPETRFIVLCRELTAEALLAAMQAGARHGVRRDALATELPPVLQRLGAQSTSSGSGRVVSVLSASGGCGCTTIAIALAEVLRQTTGSQVLLVDLDADYGAAASYLGLKGSYGVSDVLAQAGSMDAQLVRSGACRYDDDFHVLLSPAAINPSDPAPLEWTHLPGLLDAARGFAPWTVVDASRVPAAAAAELVRGSALTLLVMELAVIDIRTARSMLHGLEARGVSVADVLPVANRWSRKQGAPTLQDARDALGREAVSVANDFPAALRALNHGEPVPRSAPRSDLCEDVRRLAARLAPRPLAATNGKGR
jgi:pilus assembly protein CpaE